MKPLLSVLIPTRNRVEELSSLLAIIEKYKIADVEFIISDNSDVDLNYRNIPSLELAFNSCSRQICNLSRG